MNTERLLHASSVTILGTHVLRIHQRRKFDSRCLLNQAASTAVNITGEASENVCVAVRDRLAAKRLLHDERKDAQAKIHYR